MWGLIFVAAVVAIIVLYLWLLRRKRTPVYTGQRNKVVETFVDDPITKTPTKTLLCNRDTEECAFPQFAHPCCVSNGVEMLRDIMEIFHRRNVLVWITYGTLLGHQRHGGFMPWDNDIDLMGLRSHEGEIASALEELKTKGYEVKRESGRGAKPGQPDYDYFVVYYSRFNKLHLDIGLATRVGDILFDAPAPPPREALLPPFKQWVHPYDDVLPLQLGELYGVPVWIPNRPVDLLRHWYGGDCMRVAKIKRGDVPGTNNNLEASIISVFDPAPELIVESRAGPENPYGIAKCYVINMRSRRDRMHHTAMQCDRVGLQCEQVVAVEGKSLDIEDLIRHGVYHPIDQYQMKTNEVACALSHIKAISEIAKQPDARYLVIEDDIVFLPDFERLAPLISEQLSSPGIKWEVVFYGSRVYEKSEISRVTPLLYRAGLNVGTWAYMLTPTSARKILRSILPISYPVDLTITVPSPGFKSSRPYDKRFEGHLDKLIVYDGKEYDDGRYGVINELSTYVWQEGTSSAPIVGASSNV